MKIVGGAYRETCREPERDEFYGSGLRAAVAISRAASSLEFITVTTADEQNLVGALSEDFGFTASCEQRPVEVHFVYPTPLSAPALSPKDLARPKLSVSDETVLAFGMIDGDWTVTGTNVIVDPQGMVSLKPRVDWNGKRTAFISNRSELLAIAHGTSSAEAAAHTVLEQYGFDTVVVKCGALGAMVVERTGVSKIGVFPVQPIYPIGSGDVFSAVFAYCWGELGLPAAESARRASLGTAVWVSQGPLQVLKPSGQVVNPELLEERLVSRVPKIYLAGPFFSVAQRWLVDTLREALADLGAEVVSPFHDVGLGLPHKVAPADLEHLSTAHGVIAILDGLDPGTLFEIGYARARETPVVGFISQTEEIGLTMVVGTGVPVYRDLSTAAYQAIWAAAGV